MATTAEIMHSLPARFRPKLAGRMRAVIQFRLTGPDGGEWVLSIADGACTVRPGQAENPAACVTMAAAEFVAINTGEIGAPALFWSGRIEIEGDVEVVIGLAPVMGWQGGE